MKYRCSFLFLILLSLISSGAFAQLDSPYLKRKQLALSTKPIALDTLSIIPATLVIKVDGLALDSSDFNFDPLKGEISLKNAQYDGKTAEISFNTLPVNISRPMYRKPRTLIYQAEAAVLDPFAYTPSNNTQGGFNGLSSLNKSGSISRGINFGNAQNLGVSSNLNLQLQGKITDDIEVLAAITDENIPIQPEGNTQQLQDFDQVYIQVFSKTWKLTAGDFTLETPKSHFMKYLKRGQGLNAQLTQTHKDNGNTLQTEASAAISRGKFGRNVVQGVEGNQGPYRLTGAANEPFIIILSGTERVFIDGKQLTRGQEHDYIINYNTAELTFTAKQFITKDKRIVVEFQYADQNFARSMLQSEMNYTYKKGTLNFNFFAEQDLKNQPLQQELSDAAREQLIQAGDDPFLALFNGIDSAGFSASQVRYQLIDTTTLAGQFDSVLVYSSNPQLAIYSARFTDVGQGNGTYAISQTVVANGRVFEWVGVDEVTGAPLGRYEPVVLLVAPRQQQMISLGGEYNPTEQTQVRYELALTNQDANTFSDKDASDNLGYAAKFEAEHIKPLNSEGLNLLLGAGFEKWHRHFAEVERIRSVEFYRDWNLRNVSLNYDQDLYEVMVGLNKNSAYQLQLQSKLFQVGPQYLGIDNAFIYDLNLSKWQATGSWKVLSANAVSEVSLFERRKSLVSRQVGRLELGYRDDFERNLRTISATDSLLPNAYRFYEFEVFLQVPDSVLNGFKLSYTRRTDDAGLENKIQRATLAESYGFDFRLNKNRNSRLQGRVAYRSLRINNAALAFGQAPENSLVGRVEYNLNVFKGSITSATFYELGSGLEPRQDFIYVEVAAGQGLFAWIDYNDNGVQELDEFEIAQFPDQARFIKVQVPTNDYVRTFTNQFNQSLNINPNAIWRNKSGIKKWLSRFSNQTAFRVERKTNANDLMSRYNPLFDAIADTNLLSENTSLRNTFYFNRTHPVFGADVNLISIKGRNLLINGFQGRFDESAALNLRWNLLKTWLLTNELKLGNRGSNSDVLANRNFSIDYQEIKPILAYQPSNVFRCSAGLSYAERTNSPSQGGEKAIIRNLITEARYNSVGKGAVLATFNYVLIDFNGNPNTALAFDMLDALQPGTNLTWGLNYQRLFKNNVQLSVNYNGRDAEQTRVVHTGGVQVRAFF